MIFRFDYAFTGVSTSGAPGKHPGRVGDSALPGEDFMQVGVSNFTKQPVLRIFMNKKKNMCIFIDVLRVRREI